MKSDSSTILILLAIVTLIIIWIIASISNKIKKRKAIAQEISLKQSIKEDFLNSYTKNEIFSIHHNQFLREFDNLDSSQLKHFFQQALELKKRQDYLESKYSSDIVEKINNKNYWIGMSEEQLIDCIGNPTKIEIEELKTKSKKVLIYGNKSSGDVFTFVNGELERFKDR